MWHKFAALPIIAVMGALAILMSPRPHAGNRGGPSSARATRTDGSSGRPAEDLRDLLVGLAMFVGILLVLVLTLWLEQR